MALLKAKAILRQTLKMYTGSLAEQQINRLISSGCKLQPDEIIAIWELAKSAQKKSLDVELSAGWPVEIGHQKMYPMTIYSACWYNRHEGECNTDHERMTMLAYSLCHARSERDMPESNVTSCVKKWYQALRCRKLELYKAINLVMDQEENYCAEIDDDEEKEDGTKIEELSLYAVSLFGGSAEEWERLCSLQYVSNLITTAIKIKNGDGESEIARKANTNALRKLGRYCNGLMEKHK